ncbi:MAG: hypothetical protein JW990_15020 [Thermoleophilia bacterium]|nr:hypothetical protein [Thermoleophilia bacterium]
MDEWGLYPADPTRQRRTNPLLFEEVSFYWPKTTKHLWVTVGWALIGERWECVSLRIDVVSDVRPLQGKDLRIIKFGDLLEYATARLRARRDAFFPPGSEMEVWTLEYDDAGEVVKTVTTKPRPGSEDMALPKRKGRAPVPLTKLREVARVYEEARQKGDYPTKAVQDHFPGTRRGTAARWVWLCREMDPPLIPPLRPRGRKEAE